MGLHGIRFTMDQTQHVLSVSKFEQARRISCFPVELHRGGMSDSTEVWYPARPLSGRHMERRGEFVRNLLI